MKGSISGVVEAKCTKCKCRSVWHMDNQPFVGSEIIGVCSDCLENKEHKCFDEYLGEHGEYVGSSKEKSK